ncbi:hypothetical protein quinque_005930 [Culex quinquefasciatus]|uniref:uncharacterized protein CG13380 n=1 Tax=Culex quinquefasciatus TaxID=7176 RepID=UPI0018E37EE5|nr:uncharacterized protein CG13380 [Culex quinquefasciatus]
MKIKEAGPSRLADRLAAAAADANCICRRPETNVVCGNCSAKFFGRVQRTCPSHTHVIYLLDYGYCPKCKAPWRSLEELTAAEMFKLDLAKLRTANNNPVIRS